MIINLTKYSVESALSISKDIRRAGIDCILQENVNEETNEYLGFSLHISLKSLGAKKAFTMGRIIENILSEYKEEELETFVTDEIDLLDLI